MPEASFFPDPGVLRKFARGVSSYEEGWAGCRGPSWHLSAAKNRATVSAPLPGAAHTAWPRMWSVTMVTNLLR